MSTVVWFCCCCRLGPLSLVNVPMCGGCYHSFCDLCTAEHYGGGNSGGVSGSLSQRSKNKATRIQPRGVYISSNGKTSVTPSQGSENTKTRLQPPTTDSYLSDRSSEDGNGKIWKRLEEDLAKTCADAKDEQERMRQNDAIERKGR